MKIRVTYKNAALAVAALVMAAAFGLLVRIYSGDIIATSGMGSNRPVVIIDPGHGGVDGGAVGVDGTAEKEINLAISQKLQCLLELGGFEVIMTRETDVSIHDDSALTTRQKKVSDLHNRLAMVESHPGAIFISIHQNKFSVGKYWGTQVFYGPGHEDSSELAGLIQRSIVAELQPDNSREIKKAQKNLFILFNAKTPAVLVECGFLSNAEENKRLGNPDYQDELAFCIYTAILEYYGRA